MFSSFPPKIVKIQISLETIKNYSLGDLVHHGLENRNFFFVIFFFSGYFIELKLDDEILEFLEFLSFNCNVQRSIK